MTDVHFGGIAHVGKWLQKKNRGEEHVAGAIAFSGTQCCCSAKGQQQKHRCCSRTRTDAVQISSLAGSPRHSTAAPRAPNAEGSLHPRCTSSHEFVYIHLIFQYVIKWFTNSEPNKGWTSRRCSFKKLEVAAQEEPM